MKMICLIPVNKYDINGLKKWLNSKSARGYKLVRLCDSYGIFDKGTKNSGYYYVLPKSKDEKDNNKSAGYNAIPGKSIEISRNVNLDYICENNQMAIYYSKNKNYNINQLRNKHRTNLLRLYDDAKKSLRLSLLLIALVIALAVTFIIALRQPLMNIFVLNTSKALSVLISFLSFLYVIRNYDDCQSLKESIAFFNNDYLVHTDKLKKRNIKHGILSILVYIIVIFSFVFTLQELEDIQTVVYSDTLFNLYQIENIDADEVSIMEFYKQNRKNILLKDKYVSTQVYSINDEEIIQLHIKYYDTYDRVFADQLAKEFKEQIFYAKGIDKVVSKYRFPIQDKNILDDYEENKNYIFARDDNYQYLILKKENKIVLYQYNGEKNLKEYINKWNEL